MQPAPLYGVKTNAGVLRHARELWSKAPVWRHLSIYTLCITAVAVSAPIISQPAEDRLQPGHVETAQPPTVATPVIPVQIKDVARNASLPPNVVSSADPVIPASIISPHPAPPNSPVQSAAPSENSMPAPNFVPAPNLMPSPRLMRAPDLGSFQSTTKSSNIAPLVTASREASAPQMAALPAEPAPRPTKRECGLPFGLVGLPYIGRVTSFLTSAEAARALQLTQAHLHSTISPAYLKNQRIGIQIGGRRTVALLPPAMTVTIGDIVEVNGGYRDPNLPCNYVPAIVAKILPSSRGATAQ